MEKIEKHPMSKLAKRLMILCVAGAMLLSAAFALHRVFARENNREILVLMYHDIREEAVPGNYMIISRETFRAQLQTLQDAGFETISFDDLIAFVDYGRQLPERPVVITFDDGYRSNLTIAAPILEEFGMQATIHVIGSSRGRDTHIRTGVPSIPHFTLEEARPWVEAGVIHIQHHSYDMHHVRALEEEDFFREGALQREGESDEDYRAAFFADFHMTRQAIEEALGTAVTVYAYPYGFYSADTEAMLKELGIRVTLATHPGSNVIWRNRPESLFLLNRLNMSEAVQPEGMIAYLESFMVG